MAIVNAGKILLNTVVKVLPIGLYLATLLSSMLFDNKMALVLFFGHLLNDIVGLSYRFLLKPRGKIECAFVKVGDLFYTLPAPYIQVVSFYFSFIMADMYYGNRFTSTKFIGLLILLLITVWSRLDIGCKTMLDVILALALGSGIGLAYYFAFKEYYLSEEEQEIQDAGRSDPELINNVFKYFN